MASPFYELAAGWFNASQTRADAGNVLLIKTQLGDHIDRCKR